MDTILNGLIVYSLLNEMFTKFFAAISFSFLILFPQSLSIPAKNREHSGIVEQVEWNNEIQCLKEVLWFEARGESVEGIKAVLSVIHNRKKARGFPSTYCGVVHDKYQFSYRNHLPPGVGLKIHAQNPLDKEALDLVSLLAIEAATGKFKPTLEAKVLWYTKLKIKKPWMKKMQVVAVVSNHKFLKES